MLLGVKELVEPQGDFFGVVAGGVPRQINHDEKSVLEIFSPRRGRKAGGKQPLDEHQKKRCQLKQLFSQLRALVCPRFHPEPWKC